MFNDLNQADNQAHPAVDDIFADTDQANAPVAGGIQAKHVGLTAGAGEQEPVEKSNGPWFKIAVVAIVIVILILGGYLVYSKFMAPVAVVDMPSDTQDNMIIEPNSSEVSEEPVVENDLLVATSTEIIPLIPGVNEPSEEVSTTTEEVETVPTAPLDTDQDGLSDTEESMVGTNINIVDTDADGLSDYEEIKIYGTDPLLADTDSDGYSDGDEVRNGYNPLGAGKLGE